MGKRKNNSSLSPFKKKKSLSHGKIRNSFRHLPNWEMIPHHPWNIHAKFALPTRQGDTNHSIRLSQQPITTKDQLRLK
jgi:hypothetical protein